MRTEPAEPLRCSSGSSLRRLGGTVVIRIFTVASAELISKPVSLVSMVRTCGGGNSTPSEGLQGFRDPQHGQGQSPALPLPSLGSCALRLSTTLFPKAATASTGEQERFLEQGRALPSPRSPGRDTHAWVGFSGSPPGRPRCAPSSWSPSCRSRPGEPPRFAVEIKAELAKPTHALHFGDKARTFE